MDELDYCRYYFFLAGYRTCQITKSCPIKRGSLPECSLYFLFPVGTADYIFTIRCVYTLYEYSGPVWVFKHDQKPKWHFSNRRSADGRTHYVGSGMPDLFISINVFIDALV